MKLSQAQYAVLQDLRRMAGNQGWVWFTHCRHFDGRSVRGLEMRGLIRRDDYRYYVNV